MTGSDTNFSDVILESFDSVKSHDEPQFQRAKSSAEWNAEMLQTISNIHSIIAVLLQWFLAPDLPMFLTVHLNLNPHTS